MEARHWTLLGQANRFGKLYSQHPQKAMLKAGFLVMWAVLAFSVQAFGAERIVPDDYSTIQSAIVAAGTGDSVVVKPGTYPEHINFLGKAITVTSTDPSDWAVVESTIIDAGGTGSVVTFNSEEGTDSVLQGFVITGGYGTFDPLLPPDIAFGSGIYCIFSSPTIRRNIITGNHGPNTNTLLSQGVGIGAVLTEMVITENIITGNDGFAGAGFLVAYGNAVISNNVIDDNYAMIGGGVVVMDGPKLINNTIVNNEAFYAGGNVYASGQFEISGNIIAYGRTDYDGGGIAVEQPGQQKFAYNNVWGNEGGNYVGSIGDKTGVSGNLSQDPLFVDFDAGDYHLLGDSPCINGGDPEAAVGPTDLDGNDRIVAGRIDMGAYELGPYESALWMLKDANRRKAAIAGLMMEVAARGDANRGAFEALMDDPADANDYHHASQDLHAALQHAEQALQKLDKSIEKSSRALAVLGLTVSDSDGSLGDDVALDPNEAVCDGVYEMISIAQDLLAQIQEISASELEARSILSEIGQNGGLDQLEKGGIVKFRMSIHSASQHSTQAIDALGKCLDRLQSCFDTLQCETPEGPRWELLWSDEFDAPGITPPDPANWEHMIGNGCDYGICGWGNNELQWYTDDLSNSWVENGYLTIQAQEESPGSYTSARLRTRYRQDFLYGRMEAKIKIPHGGGMWPAFWMMPTDDVYGVWAASGEIDIMESSNQTNSVGGALHFGGQWPDNTYIGGSYYGDGNTDFSQDFHVYALEWEADQMRWYVDGVQYFTATSDQWYSLADLGNERAPFDQWFHFLLNVAVGGYYTGCTNPSCITAEFPQQMMVDYVRVYQWQE
ncbi:MAG: family 16 glycosylhydrolase [Planctomycetota bacterium]|jgi:beta-glucanase (GH16 family)